MEPQRFDELSKSAANGISRRQILAFLASGLSGLGVLFGCNQVVGNPRDDPTDVPSTAAPPRCSTSEQRCRGACVDVQSNDFNCGGCGIVCSGAVRMKCVAGACRPVVDERETNLCEDQGLTTCRGVCVDLRTDPANCGGCGIVCGGANACLGGACQRAVVLACDDQGLTDCGGVCVDTSSDRVNCGGCGVGCQSGVCESGVCSPAATQAPTMCAAGNERCGDICVDLQTDRANCGACSFDCTSGVCEGGVCRVPACGGPFTACGGVCVDTSTDPTNCGGCGIICSGEVRMQCVDGVCSPVVDKAIDDPVAAL